MMKIALFPNVNKPRSKNLSLGIKEYLTSRGAMVVARDEDAEMLGVPPLSSIDSKELDCLISMGGDGTILRLMQEYPDLQVPILAINLGSLGFMADIPIADVYPSLQDLLAGNYKVDERLMMCGITPTGNSCYAVNELVVHRASNPSLIDLAIHVDGLYLNTFCADGIIISTPSGSTAYSLSAGGPILDPNLQALVLTPISPHTISNRPLVFLPSQEVQIQYLSEHDPVEITVDGSSRHTLNTGEVFRIRPTDRKFRMVQLDRHDYFATLRTKLGWTGRLRS